MNRSREDAGLVAREQSPQHSDAVGPRVGTRTHTIERDAAQGEHRRTGAGDGASGAQSLEASGPLCPECEAGGERRERR